MTETADIRPPSLWMPEPDTGLLQILGKTAEEASELAGRASRCSIQGMKGIDPKTGRTNREELLDEIADVLALAEVLTQRAGVTLAELEQMEIRSNAKAAQKRAWLAMVDREVADTTPPAEGWNNSIAERDVMQERLRQVSGEGFTAEQDDAHDPGVLAGAASQYALHAATCLHPYSQGDGADQLPDRSTWLVNPKWFKPTSPRQSLIKAAALTLAEIERMDRAYARTGYIREEPTVTTQELRGIMGLEADEPLGNSDGNAETHDGEWRQEGDGRWAFYRHPEADNG